jgi:endonuclease/exonuclease/phosphatase family metal-dependent hydrolase
MKRYSEYPLPVVEDVARLRRRIERSGLPDKRSDSNLLVGTWNIRALGGFHPRWAENPDSPKRNLRSLALVAEVVRRFDVIAIQEVKRDTSAIRTLLSDFLGANWGMIVSDVTAGSAGNAERLAFVYDKRRVQPSGLAGEIVLPPSADSSGAPLPAEQFARTPYIVGFVAGEERFVLLTVHIKYGDVPEDRLPELRAMAEYAAFEIRDRARLAESEEANVIVLGDFNIDKRGDNPLFQTFVSTGLIVPAELLGLKTTYGSEPKYYDHIAWFMGDFELDYSGRAGVIDFADAVYQEITMRQMSYRVSDHFPLWVEFITDHSAQQMAPTLGLDPAMPNPLEAVPD